MSQHIEELEVRTVANGIEVRVNSNHLRMTGAFCDSKFIYVFRSVEEMAGWMQQQVWQFDGREQA